MLPAGWLTRRAGCHLVIALKLVCMPTHYIPPRWSAPVVRPERIEGSCAPRLIVDAGARELLGTDFPSRLCVHEQMATKLKAVRCRALIFTHLTTNQPPSNPLMPPLLVYHRPDLTREKCWISSFASKRHRNGRGNPECCKSFTTNDFGGPRTTRGTNLGECSTAQVRESCG